MRERDRRDQTPDHVGEPARIAPGKRTLTMGLLPGPVQRKGREAGGELDDDTLAAAAARGIATPSSKLPYGDTVQASFGRHRIDHVRAHEGAAAAASADAIDAEAYATGDHVVLGGMPTLFTVAHEAAHVVQQRAGVARKSSGDGDRFERHADAVAEAVVAGRSAETLLDEVAPPGAGGGAAVAPVQRIIKVKGVVRKTLRGLPPSADVQRMHADKRHAYVFSSPEHLHGYAAGTDLVEPEEEELDEEDDEEMEPEPEPEAKKKKKLKTGGKRRRRASSEDEKADDGEQADTESEDGQARRKRVKEGSKKGGKGRKGKQAEKLSPEAGAFLDELGDHAADAKTEAGADRTAEYRAELLDQTTQEHRDADRFAFTLADMNSKRVCVAAAEHDDGYDLFANVPDDDLAGDGQRLAEAAEDPDKFREMKAEIEELPPTHRIPDREENAERRAEAEERERARRLRRLHKTARLLRKQRQARKKPLAFATPGASEVEEPVHAEQQATDHAHQEEIEYKDMGISKLCCLKCWLALGAAEQEGIHARLGTGTHAKSYDSANGWPIPSYVADNPEVLKAMVGDRAYAILEDCEDECNDVLKRKKVPKVKGAGTTDIVSSEEEYDHLAVLEGKSKKPGKKPPAKKKPAKAKAKPKPKGSDEDMAEQS